MKSLFISLLTGVLVGVIYTIANVRSPLPSLVVMVGFFGMYAGQQVPDLLIRWADNMRTAPLPPPSQEALSLRRAAQDSALSQP